MASSHLAGVARLGVAAAILLLGAPANPDSQRAPQFMSKQCNEDAIRVHLDPHPFQQLVGTKFSLVLEDGKAVLLILAQDCSQYWLDGKDLGPTQEIHVWLSIDGPNDTRPVVGAQITRPTMTWVRLFDGSTNPQHRNARMTAGSVLTAIEGVSLDPPGSQRGGRASLGKGLVYSWRVVSAPPPARMVGVNHDVRNPGIAADASVDQIQALVCMSAAASPGTLQVTRCSPGSRWAAIRSL